ncbi:MAG: L-threonylcarbamoyladenylate synthase [Bacteroidota bacterium]
MQNDTATIGRDLEFAIEKLEANGLVAIPTETVYGLAANALEAEAVVKIFEAKKRPSFDPLIVHIKGTEDLAKYAKVIPDQAGRLAQALWPGPLTIVLPKHSIIPDLTTSGLDSVAIRSPRHSLTRQLLGMLDFPLAAPSANPFGYLSPTRPEHVADQLAGEVDYILDGGPCEVGLESTIISFIDPGKIEMLRAGGYVREEIEEILGTQLSVRTHSSSNPSAPGMLAQHYAPRTPLLIVDADEVPDMNTLRSFGFLEKSKNPKIAYIKLIPTQNPPEWATDAFAWSDDGNLRQAAARLFALLRTLDGQNYDLIVAERVPPRGLGLAINDRLSRAAHQS